MNDRYKTNIKDPADTSEEAIYRAHVQRAAMLGYGIEKRAQYCTSGGPPHWTKHDPSNGFDFVRFTYRVLDDEGYVLDAWEQLDAGPEAQGKSQIIEDEGMMFPPWPGEAQEHDPYIGSVAPKVRGEVEALARAVANKYGVELAGLQVTIKPKARKPREFFLNVYDTRAGRRADVHDNPESADHAARLAGVSFERVHVREVIDGE